MTADGKGARGGKIDRCGCAMSLAVVVARRAKDNPVGWRRTIWKGGEGRSGGVSRSVPLPHRHRASVRARSLVPTAPPVRPSARDPDAVDPPTRWPDDDNRDRDSDSKCEHCSDYDRNRFLSRNQYYQL